MERFAVGRTIIVGFVAMLSTFAAPRAMADHAAAQTAVGDGNTKYFNGD